MTPVTDPAILAQLNGPQSGPKPVTDPAILAQLNGDTDKIGNPVAETKRAFNENVDAMKQGLGPQRTSNTLAEMANRPFWDITPQINSVLSFGKGVMAVPGAVAAPVTGTARTVIGAPLAATAQAVDEAAKAKGIAPPNSGGNYADLGRSGADMAMSGVAARGYSPVGPRLDPAPIPSAVELKQAGRAVYQDPAIQAIKIPPSDVSNLSAQINNDLSRQGFRATPGNAPSTFAELDRMVPGAGVTDVGVDDLRSARRALNIAAGQRDQFGGVTPDANAARQAIAKIDGFLDNLAPSLKDANANYAAGKQAEQLDFRKMKADHRAAKSGSGTNIENTMRQEVDKISNRGLTPNEQVLRNQIVEGTPMRNALRRFGKVGYGDGLSLLQHMIVDTATAGATVPIGIAGTIARKTGEGMTRRAIEQLNNAIRSRAPLTSSRPPVIAKASSPAQIAATLLMLHGGPRTVGMMPAYADQNQ